MGKQRACLAITVAFAWLVVLYRVQIRPRIYRWGATSDEVAVALPGDELVRPGLRTTRAITIDAPVTDVWPWLAQIGEHRGGFYSYSLLERSAGCDIHNADVIHPEWQSLAVGDTIWLAQRYGRYASQVVAAVCPNSYLVLMSPMDYEAVQHGRLATGSWAFHLRTDAGHTRLIIRGSGGPIGHVWYDIVHFIMEQKMMRGIRDRARRNW